MPDKPDWMKPSPNARTVRKIESLVRELYAARGEDPMTAWTCNEIEKLVKWIE